MIRHDVSDLKRRITALVMASRRRERSLDRPYIPRFVSEDLLIDPDGRRQRRLKIIMMSNGCSVPTCTMCPFTNENNYGRRDTAEQALIDQVRVALTGNGREAGHDCVALYNDGSFFAPREVSDRAARAIAAAVAERKFSLLTVESLPQFVTEARLLPFLEALEDVSLEVGLGLQSANPTVRELCINTSFDNRAFEQAVELLLRHGVRVKSYVMLKPPFLSEEEAVGDALASFDYCRSLGAPGITLCPTRVAPNTLAWDLMQQGVYSPPNLWSIVDTVRRAPPDVMLRVACVNLRGGDFTSVFPDSCPSCADAVVDALMASSIGEPGALDLARCGCTPHAVEPVPVPEPALLMDRIRLTLDRLPAGPSPERPGVPDALVTA